MSSRVLKKLQGGSGIELDLPKEDVDQNQASEDDEDDISRGRGIHLNPFDLLNQNSPSESEVKEDDNETEHTSTANNVATGAGGAAASAKKKKKKRKKKSKYTGNPISSEDNELTDKYLSDIDSLIGKVSVATNATQHLNLQPPRIQIDKSLLSVELRNLNPHNEMRRTFGKRVVKIENKRGRQKLTLKSTYMVTAKESWPPLTKNIIMMKPTNPPDCNQSGATTASGSTAVAGTTSQGTVAQSSSKASKQSVNGEKIQWFAFEHSKYYQSVQNQFLPAVERTDSDFLITLIRRCPYHVDSLIQLSELCKMTEDYTLAAELIERAVLVLESSLHPSFSLTSGNCRLDYRRQENRTFFIVLFKHAQYLEARACCRTAFELSKLILSLNPEVDPLAMVLIVDYYALRSKQYAWMIKFYEEYDAIRNVSQLPNMAYSYALANFCLNGPCEQSDKALQYALLMFPGVLRLLLEELGVQPDKNVQNCSYFNTEVSFSLSPALHQLICLYICRAKAIWRQTNIIPWLENNVNIALKRIEAKEDVINDYIQKRNSRYVAPPRPILRHIFLSDFKEKVPLAPFLAREKDSIVMYDPLPPLDSVNFYERQSSSSSPTTANSRSVSLLFHSLLPNFNMNNVAAGGDAAAAAGGVVAAAAGGVVAADGIAGDALAAAFLPNGNDNLINAAAAAAAGVGDNNVIDNGEDEVALVDRHLEELNVNLENAANEAALDPSTHYRELTQSLTGIVDAMRDFLQNFRIAESLQIGDGAEEQSSEEDSSDYYD